MTFGLLFSLFHACIHSCSYKLFMRYHITAVYGPDAIKGICLLDIPQTAVAFQAKVGSTCSRSSCRALHVLLLHVFLFVYSPSHVYIFTHTFNQHILVYVLVIYANVRVLVLCLTFFLIGNLHTCTNRLYIYT